MKEPYTEIIEALELADRSFTTIRNAPGTTLNPHHISTEAYQAHLGIRWLLKGFKRLALPPLSERSDDGKSK